MVLCMAKRLDTRIVLDSCVWIAFLCKADSQHDKANKLIETLRAEIVVPEYVLLEVATVLRQKKYNAEACVFIEKVINDPAVFLPTHDSVYGVAKLFCTQNRSTLSFVDVALLAMSAIYTVVTFDNALARAIVRKKKK
jgi:predicted nucleic acid-binding protein